MICEYVGVKFTVLHVAGMFGSIEIIQWYRNNKKALGISDMNPYDSENLFTPMLLAVEYRQLNVINDYMENEKEEVWNKATGGADIYYKGWTPLHSASFNGYNSIVERLLKNVTNKRPKDETGLTPLHWSASKGYLDVTNTLINAINDSTKINEVNLVSGFSYPIYVNL